MDDSMFLPGLSLEELVITVARSVCSCKPSKLHGLYMRRGPHPTSRAHPVMLPNVHVPALANTLS